MNVLARRRAAGRTTGDLRPHDPPSSSFARRAGAGHAGPGKAHRHARQPSESRPELSCARSKWRTIWGIPAKTKEMGAIAEQRIRHKGLSLAPSVVRVKLPKAQTSEWVEKTAGGLSNIMRSCRNRYFFFHNDEWISILDADKDAGCPLGGSYYWKVLRIIESRNRFSGLTFYVSVSTPKSLPTYGRDVVLLLIGDEDFGCSQYFLEILAIVRSFGSRPYYSDGWPTNYAKIVSLLFFLNKFRRYLRGLWRTTKFQRSLLIDIDRRTLHVPLGYFGKFEPTMSIFASRQIDYAFLGSLDRRKHPWYSPLGLMRPPKIATRNEMLKALSLFSSTRAEPKGIVAVTENFTDSANNMERYAQVMANCKISICPRGSNPETFRFYESCKAGCVIICDPIPDTWFYRAHPGIVIEDWQDLPGLLDSLLASPAEMERLSDATLKYWESNLAEEVAANRIEAFLLDLLDRQAGPVAETCIAP